MSFYIGRDAHFSFIKMDVDLIIRVRSLPDKLYTSSEMYILLCLSPISRHVVKAYAKISEELNSPLCFAASLNQVDKDGGYTDGLHIVSKCTLQKL